MGKDLEKARERLQRNCCTLVLCRGDSCLESSLRGVAPLMQLLQEGRDVSGFSAADKVIGKAAAFLYCLLQVRQVYGCVISRPALQVLQVHGIGVQYGILTEEIQNRSRTGPCPMEAAVITQTNPQCARVLIEKALVRLNTKTE